MLYLGYLCICNIDSGGLLFLFLISVEIKFDPELVRSNRVVVFTCRSLRALKNVIMCSGEMKRKLVMGILVIMIKLHSFCWEAVVYESKREVFINFG